MKVTEALKEEIAEILHLLRRTEVKKQLFSSLIQDIDILGLSHKVCK